jgi:BMFP domain-containing protein YqiC
MVQEGKKEFKTVQDKIASLMNKGLEKLDVVSKEEFQALEERVEALESQTSKPRPTRKVKKKTI